MKNNLIYLKHIRDSINDINEAISGITYAEFLENKILLKAVVRDLEIIGEAAGKMSQDFRDANPQIPWRDMIDMRNVLIHEYFGVIPETVWKTCTENLPELKIAIDALL
ncbi:MAG: DUF86 domain-containing protein [Candidatus Moranbacteria bacterium]|nr:DUF86 domain-containing protein [Candidatus Moranbacteria bacterium]